MNLNTITTSIRRKMAATIVAMMAMFMCFMLPVNVGANISAESQELSVPAVTAEYTAPASAGYAENFGAVTMDNITYVTQDSVNYDMTYFPVHGQRLSTYAQAPRTAVPLTGTNLHTDLDLDALFAGVVEIILKMGLYVGGALAVSGVFQLLLSYYNDQPEGKAAALRLTVVGGALMGMRGLLQLIGLIG